MVATEPQEELTELEILQRDIGQEIERVKEELHEIDLLLGQSQLEVSKLTQKNTAISAHIHQVQAQFDSTPRADIRQAYETALDAQQRLFVLKGQVDKLQSDRLNLERLKNFLVRVTGLLDGNSQPGGRKFGSGLGVDTVELIINAQEAERQRLSKQMHDGPAQALSNLILQSEIAMRLFDKDQALAREELGNLKTSAMSTFQQVRDFIFELRPMMLDDLGLVPTIKRYRDVVNEQQNVEATLTMTGNERRLEPYLEIMIFRGIQELVSNAIRHGQATEIKLHLDTGENNVKVVVDDNGRGIETTSSQDNDGMGMKVLKERMEMLGGYLEVDSLPGQGTRVSFQVPAKTVNAFS